jgi:hypothetical protein
MTITDRQLEQENLLRWDRTGDAARLYTADPLEARRWQQLGYPVQAQGRGWTARVPIQAIALLPMAGATVIAGALDDWETRRLRALMPSLTKAEIQPLLRQRGYGHVMPTFRQAQLVAWE